MAGVVSCRQIRFFDVAPDTLPLSRRHIRVLVDSVLKFIDRNAVRQKQKRVAQMGEPVFVGVFAEKELHPRPCEKLHAHRVDFTRLKRRPVVFRNVVMAALIHLERMPSFMGEHINVAGRPGKVRENKRRLIVIDIGAIAAARLSFFWRRGPSIHVRPYSGKTRLFPATALHTFAGRFGRSNRHPLLASDCRSGT